MATGMTVTEVEQDTILPDLLESLKRDVKTGRKEYDNKLEGIKSLKQSILAILPERVAKHKWVKGLIDAKNRKAQLKAQLKANATVEAAIKTFYSRANELQGLDAKQRIASRKRVLKTCTRLATNQSIVTNYMAGYDRLSDTATLHADLIFIKMLPGFKRILGADVSADFKAGYAVEDRIAPGVYGDLDSKLLAAMDANATTDDKIAANQAAIDAGNEWKEVIAGLKKLLTTAKRVPVDVKDALKEAIDGKNGLIKRITDKQDKCQATLAELNTDRQDECQATLDELITDRQDKCQATLDELNGVKHKSASPRRHRTAPDHQPRRRHRHHSLTHIPDSVEKPHHRGHRRRSASAPAPATSGNTEVTTKANPNSSAQIPVRAATIALPPAAAAALLHDNRGVKRNAPESPNAPKLSSRHKRSGTGLFADARFSAGFAGLQGVMPTPAALARLSAAKPPLSHHR